MIIIEKQPLVKIASINKHSIENIKLFECEVPGDKSISQRATFITSLAQGKSQISGLLWSDDIINNLFALQQLGVGIEKTNDSDIVISGVGINGYHQLSTKRLYLGNSATSARIMIALLSGHNGVFTIDSNSILRKRSINWLIEPLQKMGANFKFLKKNGYLPVQIYGTSQLKEFEYHSKLYSAQSISAMMFASLHVQGPSTIYRQVLARDHTERLFKFFEIELYINDYQIQVIPPKKIIARNINIPGDISSAAFIIALIVMYPDPNLKITIKNVGLNPTRLGFIKTLKEMGANIDLYYKDIICNEPRGNISVSSGSLLKGMKISGNALIQSMIDEVTLLSIIATLAIGKTEIEDIGELNDKDSNRIITTLELLKVFGINATATSTSLTIYPGKLKSPKYFTATNDHRITMSAVVLAATLSEETIIDGLEIVKVSFPNFIEIISNFANVKIIESELS